MTCVAVGAASRVINNELGTEIQGGGYSADPFYWSRLVPEGRDLIVDVACRLLKRLWSDR